MSRASGRGEYSHLNRLHSPASRLIRRSIWAPEEDIGQQSFITPRYLDDLIARLGIGRDSRVLDVGSGPGGPAVYIARATGCRLCGIELDPDGVRTATELASAAGVEDRVEFHAADAMRMPFPDGRFDIAICLNVMNVFADKVGLFREVRRVLVPAGTWAVLSGTFELPDDPDIRSRMSRGGHLPQHFDSLADYRTKLAAAGFLIEEITEYVTYFRLQVGRWAAAYRQHAAAVAAEQGEDAAERHIDYFETHARLIDEGRAANHLIVATATG